MPHILIPSPVGELLLEHDGAAIVSLRFWGECADPPSGTRGDPADGDALGRRAVEQLGEYFVGERREFDLPVRPSGTEFQRRVWDALVRIPFGETRTYGELARLLGTAAARAVGQANARNRIPIIVPCHRVLASGGGIGGYAGDWGEGEGIVRKRWLLAHEAPGVAAVPSAGRASAAGSR